jgi:hypothetical protein
MNFAYINELNNDINGIYQTENNYNTNTNYNNNTNYTNNENNILNAPLNVPEAKWSDINFYSNQNAYYFPLPVMKLKELMQEYGIPSVMNNFGERFAIWDYTKLHGLYYRIEIIDNQILYNHPYSHVGFLYVSYKIDIPLNKIAQALSISNDIQYNITEKILKVRGMSMSYCNTLIVIVAKYSIGIYSWYDLKNKDILQKHLSLKWLQNVNQKMSNISYIKSISFK